MRHFILAGILLVGITFTINAADSWKEALEVIEKPCSEFIERQVKPEFVKKWRKKLDERIEQRITDSGGGYDNHLQSIFLDWAAGKEKKLKDGDRESYIELCLFVMVFKEKNIDPPSMVRERLTVEVAQQFVDKLNQF